MSCCCCSHFRLSEYFLQYRFPPAVTRRLHLKRYPSLSCSARASSPACSYVIHPAHVPFAFTFKHFRLVRFPLFHRCTTCFMLHGLVEHGDRRFLFLIPQGEQPIFLYSEQTKHANIYIYKKMIYSSQISNQSKIQWDPKHHKQILCTWNNLHVRMDLAITCDLQLLANKAET